MSQILSTPSCPPAASKWGCVGCLSTQSNDTRSPDLLEKSSWDKQKFKYRKVISKIKKKWGCETNIIIVLVKNKNQIWMLIDHCLYKQTTIVFATNHGQILGSSKEDFELFLSKWYRRRMTSLTRFDITVSQPLPNSWPTNLFRGNMYQWSHLCWWPVGKMLVLQGSARPYGSIQKAFLSVFNSAHPGANQVKSW